jgi:hypothetical protein
MELTARPGTPNTPIYGNYEWPIHLRELKGEAEHYDRFYIATDFPIS